MTNLHNSLHNYCTIPILPEMNPIQQAIIKHLYKWAGTIGSNIHRDLAADFPDKSRRTFYYHLKLLKNMGLVEETSLTKPFPLQLTWTGRQCVQLGSARVTDRSWVRLEKASVTFDLLEIYEGDLNDFKNNILLAGKWGLVVSVTDNNWTKIIIKSRFPFSREGLLNSDLVLLPSSVSILVLIVGPLVQRQGIEHWTKQDILKHASGITLFVVAWKWSINDSIGKEKILPQNLNLHLEWMLINELESKMASTGLINPRLILRWVFGPLNKQRDNSWFLINLILFLIVYRMYRIISTLSKSGYQNCRISKICCKSSYGGMVND